MLSGRFNGRRYTCTSGCIIVLGTGLSFNDMNLQPQINARAHCAHDL